MVSFWWTLFSWLGDGQLFTVSSCVWIRGRGERRRRGRGRKFSGVSCTGTYPTWSGPCPMTSFYSNCFCKDSICNYSHLHIWICVCGKHNSIHSRRWLGKTENWGERWFSGWQGNWGKRGVQGNASPTTSDDAVSDNNRQQSYSALCSCHRQAFDTVPSHLLMPSCAYTVSSILEFRKVKLTDIV